MLGAVAAKQGILLATITHYDIVLASYLTCLLPQRTIYGRLKCFISITYKLVSLGTYLTKGTLIGRGCSSTQSTPPKYAPDDTHKVCYSFLLHSLVTPIILYSVVTA